MYDVSTYGVPYMLLNLNAPNFYLNRHSYSKAFTKVLKLYTAFTGKFLSPDSVLQTKFSLKMQVENINLNFFRRRESNLCQRVASPVLFLSAIKFATTSKYGGSIHPK